jgi:hypothetical protein
MGLPVPKSIQEAADRLEQGEGFVAGVNLAVEPIQPVTVDLGPYQAEYVFNRGDAHIHYFRKQGGLFHGAFRDRLFRAFQAWPGKHRGIDIQFYDEVQSWCVTVKGGGEMPPGRDSIIDVIRRSV